MGIHDHIADRYQESRMMLRRSIAILICLLIAVFILITRLAILQIHDHNHYKTLARENRLGLVPIEPNRGLIYDRNGLLLAKNTPVFSLDVLPDQVKNLNDSITQLQKIIPISPTDLQAFHRQLKQKRRFEDVPLKLKLTPEQVATFSVNAFRFPGIVVKAHLIRDYPLGEQDAAVLGYTGRINEQELQHVDAANYSATNFIGKVGVERYFESLLHGQVGYKRVETNAQGEAVRTLRNTPPTPGATLFLTIDDQLQAAAEKALGDHRGAVVVIQPSTGQVLALVSNPSYDPNQFVLGMAEHQYNALANAPAQPLYNRAIRGQYPFGSTIKPFIALEGLATHTITPQDQIFDPGYFQLPNSQHVYHDWKRSGHGWVNVTRALEVSCDTYFYHLAALMGINKIDTIMNAFGFGHITSVQMIEELPGLIPSPAWKLKSQGIHWYTGDTIISSIGQGYMLATPIQLAQGVATIAERGKRYQPNLLLKIQMPDGTIINQSPIVETPVEEPADAWNTVIQGMTDSVTQLHGNAYRVFGANPPPYTVAGKTGTAQVFASRGYAQAALPSRLRDHSLFIAFAPVENPQIAIAVVIENSSGATNVARHVMDAYLIGQKHAPTQSNSKPAAAAG